MSEIRFLGYVVSDQGISPDPKKVDSITSFHRPENLANCRSFLGLVNFVGQFIPNLATKADPIRQLTHAGVVYKWGEAQQSAFNRIDGIMSKAETLAHFDPGAATVLSVMPPLMA